MASSTDTCFQHGVSDCPYCKPQNPVFEAVPERPAKVTDRQSNQRLLLVAVAIAVGAGFLLVLNLGQSDQAPGVKPSPTRHRTFAGAGDKARLVSGNGATGIWVAATPESFDRLGKLVYAKDMLGIQQLELSGVVWTEPIGTKVLMIDPGLASCEVRILEGPRLGRSCFVITEGVSHD
jgi:hypothetical protein